MTENPNAFKHRIGPQAVELLADLLSGAAPNFDQDAFVGAATRGLDELELKDRVRHISASLAEHLPADYPEAVRIIVDALPPQRTDTEELSSGFEYWALCHFVQTEGLEHPEVSLDAMYQLTPHFSAEFAIRPYLLRHPELVFARLREWTEDSNPHVRRLVSEGTRPRLPWGIRLQPLVDDPAPSLPLLEALRRDDEEYVRRSVANHLNDIAKDHPDLVVETAERWWQDATPDEQRMIRHALRTLVKKGHSGALAVLGYGEVDVDVVAFEVSPPSIALGESVVIRATLRSESSKAQELLIDYAVHHQRANGSTTPKVFKWKQTTLDPGKSRKIQKKHSMKVVTTRTYYPGRHVVELQINGDTVAEAAFDLRVD